MNVFSILFTIYNIIWKYIFTFFYSFSLDDRDATDDTTTIVTVTAKVWYVSDFTGGSFPQSVIDSFGEDDTPQKRAEAVVKNNLDYMNFALANSEIPMRYIVWGDVQDIGKTEAEMIPESCQDSYCFSQWVILNLLIQHGVNRV